MIRELLDDHNERPNSKIKIITNNKQEKNNLNKDLSLYTNEMMVPENRPMENAIGIN